MKQSKLQRKVSGVGIVSCCIVTLFAVLCLVPFLYIIAASFSDESSLIREGYHLLPRKISFEAYQMVLGGRQIWDSYKAVSYTHLDVYKRQLLHLLAEFKCVWMDLCGNCGL